MKLQHSVQIGSADVSAKFSASVFKIVQDLQEHTKVVQQARQKRR